MAVSKRLRYEVLRRDGHACRYCGHTAPDVPLTVDHVIPVALGGSDEPENLVTACGPCNSGKSSSSPDAPIVAGVADDALRWARAMQMAAQEQLVDRAEMDEYIEDFHIEWVVGYMDVGKTWESFPRPADWTRSVERFYALGLEPELRDRAVRTTMHRRGGRLDGPTRGLR
jgi:hypothetical protein